MVPGVHQERGGHPSTWSNEMELTAILKALEWVYENNTSAVIYTDSQLAINLIYTRSPRNYVNLIFDIKQLLGESNLTWVRGHAGNKQNERADALARLGAQEIMLEEDIC